MNIFAKITRRSLARNPGRTTVTVIGVVLSVALITGVLAFATSLQNYLMKLEAMSAGDWHAKVTAPAPASLHRAEGDKRVVGIGTYREITYLKPSELAHSWKPYIQLVSFDSGLEEMAKTELLSGRMPENPTEVVLPENLFTEGDYPIHVGDVLTLPAGDRISTGEIQGPKGTVLHSGNPFDESEDFAVRGMRTYTVVGISEKTGVETYASAAYIGLSLPEAKTSGPTVAFFKVKPAKRIHAFVQTYFPLDTVEYNENLLIYSGGSVYSAYNMMVIILCGALILLIIIGSVALMYNAFSISVSERIRETGMLSSVGATRKQLRRSVYYESLLISAVGIPLGVVGGLLGIAAALHFMEGFFKGFAGETDAPEPSLYISPQMLLLAVVLSFITMMISAVIPAIRASRTPIMNALRQTTSHGPSPLFFSVPRFLMHKTGFEGMFAGKSYWRNRRKYRPTILSLVLSIALFISANVVGSYFVDMEKAIAGSTVAVDIEYMQNGQLNSAEEADRVRRNYAKLAAAPGIQTKQYIETLFLTESDQDRSPGTSVLVLEENAYAAYLSTIGQDPVETPVVEYVEGKETEKGDAAPPYYKVQPRTVRLSQDKTYTMTVSGETTKNPGISGHPDGAALVMSRTTAMDIFGEDYISMVSSRGGYFKCKDPDKTYAAMERICMEQDISSNGLWNLSGERKTTEDMIKIINILAYGFVILISLIAIANVFNTISTNIMVRKGEFALLKAVGMDQRGLQKMVRYESFIYGFRALAIGLTLSLLLSFLLHLFLHGAMGGLSLRYIFPWRAVLISICSVFLIILATMTYAMRRVARGELTDILKNETL